MQVDAEALRQYYGSLSDEGLLAINPADLTDVAKSCHAAGLERRNLVRRSASTRAAPLSSRDESSDSEAGYGIDLDDNAHEKPDWLDSAAEVYSRLDLPGVVAEDVANARDVLRAAGIPCYVEMRELPDEDPKDPPPRHQWRVVVPGNLNLRAASILDRDIFNDEFEAIWKAHLEELSDTELRSMTPQVVFCGLFDRVERILKVYGEELARRGLDAPPVKR